MAKHFQILRSNERETTLLTTCRMCKTVSEIVVPTTGWTEWVDGAMIQDAMPTLTPGTREQLISGSCEPCFDRLWAEAVR